MYIKSLELENFTALRKADIEFSKGINVIIGENGTGKSHLLKLLYLSTKAIRDKGQGKGKKKETYSSLFMDYFKPDRIGKLVRNKKESASIDIKFDYDANIKFNISSYADKLIKDSEESKPTTLSKSKTIYVPTFDMFTHFEGFISFYGEYELPYDKTIFDIADLYNFPDKKITIEDLHDDDYSNLLQIEEEIGFKVRKENGRFYFDSKNSADIYEASLMAEGIKKLSSVLYLAKKGQLPKKSILFWDEPEVNLNPRYINIAVRLLELLANYGVQIFIATHDYLLSHLLSLPVEQGKKAGIKFFSLNPSENGTEIESGKTLLQIKNNTILEEYTNYFDKLEGLS